MKIGTEAEIKQGYTYGNVGGTTNSDSDTPQWFDVRDYGAIGDGTTDDTTAFVNTIAAATASGAANGNRLAHLYASGKFRLNSTINLASYVTYDFTEATFYPGAGTTATYLFLGTSLTDFSILGGHFGSAAFSPSTTVATGTYVDTTAIHLNGCDRFNVSGCRFDEYWTCVNVYNSTNGQVVETLCNDCNAGVAVIAATAECRNIGVNWNDFIGMGDDSITFSPNTATAFNVESCEAIGNYIDKTRIGAIAAAVGIRSGRYNGSTGTINNLIIANNTMLDMSQQGLYIHNTYDSIIEGNQIRNYGYTAAPAITLGVGTGFDVGRLKVVNNVVRGPQLTGNPGISCDHMTDSLISSNTVYADVDTGAAAIWLYDGCTGNNVSNNYLQNANGSCIVEAGTSDNNKILGNRTAVSSGASIVLAGAATVLNRFDILPSYADNAAALIGGLLPSEFYRVTGGDMVAVVV